MLDQTVIDQAHNFEGTKLATEIAVFGRGSIETPGAEPVPYHETVELDESERTAFDDMVKGLFEEMITPRELTEAGKERVRAVGAYAFAHEKVLRERAEQLGRPVMRVLFSCGWAAASGQQQPPERFREARMMMEFAEELGMLDYFKGVVVFGEQIDSSTTIGDAVHAAKSNFFGRHGGKKFSPDRQLGVVSHEPHMARCIDAMRWAFKLKRKDILAIPAQGDDKNTVGTPEWATRLLMRVGTAFAHRSHDSLLGREARIMSVVRRLQSRGNKDSAASLPVPENV